MAKDPTEKLGGKESSGTVIADRHKGTKEDPTKESKPAGYGELK